MKWKVKNIHIINKRHKLYAGSCPKCNTYVSQEDDDNRNNKYCPECGKKLKYKEEAK